MTGFVRERQLPHEHEWAERVKAVFGMPENALKGAVSLDGTMFERLHLAQAERILALDAAIQAASNA